MSRWQSVTLPLSPGALWSTIMRWNAQLTKTHLKINSVEQFFMWNANFVCLSSENRPLSAPSLTPSYSNNTCVNCPAYMTSRAIPSYRENSWCTACTLCCLVSMHRIHCLKALIIPNVLREYFELNTLSIYCTHFSLDFTLARFIPKNLVSKIDAFF